MVYCEKDKTEWNDFVSTSRNGTFLFYRDYMEYHSDRFKDYSLIVKDNRGRIIALLPANQKGSLLASHGGLTYGGFIINPKMTTKKMIDVFENVLQGGSSVFVLDDNTTLAHIAPSYDSYYDSLSGVSSYLPITGDTIILLIGINKFES